VRVVPTITSRDWPVRAFFARGWAGGWLVAEQTPRVTLVDPRLETIATVTCRQAPTDVAITSDGRWLTYATPAGLVRVDVHDGGEVWAIPQPTQACREVDDRLWSVAADGPDRLVLTIRDPSDGDAIRDLTLPDPFGGSSVMLWRHPDSQTIVVWVAGGQDGQATWVVSDDGRALTAKELPPRDAVPPEFSDDGRHYVVSTEERGLERRAWPSGEVLGELPWPAELDDGDDFPSGEIRLLPGDYAAWPSGNGRTWLVDLQAMAIVDELTIDGHPLVPTDERYPRLAPHDTPITDLGYSEAGPDGLVLTVHGQRGLVVSRLASWSPDPTR
jgi:hypothetical protein